MAGKYHIKKNGTTGICNAVKQCPLGDAGEHFESPEKAQQYADKRNEAYQMNIKELEGLATVDDKENDVYRNVLYDRMFKDSIPEKFTVEGLNAADFNEGDSGASLDIKNGVYVKNGFAVSPYPEYSKALPGELSDEELHKELNEYIEKHKDVLNQKNHIVGLWRSPHDGNLYIDVSIVVNKATKAREISLDKEQQAYFDFQTFEAITVDPNAASGQGELSPLEKEKKELLNTYNNSDLSKLKKKILERKIRKLNEELGKPPYDGYMSEEDYSAQQEKIKQQEIEREKKVKEFELKEKASLSRAEKLGNQETISLPKSIEQVRSNYLYKDGYFNRVNVLDKKGVFRGENTEGAVTNTGTARYGLGRYTTTSKAYASKFGTVRKVELEELPVRPLSFKDEKAFEHFEYEVAKENGIDRKHLYANMGVEDLIQKMGYDGVTIGPKEDMTIVSFSTDKNFKKVRGY